MLCYTKCSSTVVLSPSFLDTLVCSLPFSVPLLSGLFSFRESHLCDCRRTFCFSAERCIFSDAPLFRLVRIVIAVYVLLIVCFCSTGRRNPSRSKVLYEYCSNSFLQQVL